MALPIYVLSLLIGTKIGLQHTSDSSRIFKLNRSYNYRATYIDRSGDTISTEEIVLIPLEKPWKFQPKIQTSLNIKYNYTKQDSAMFLKILNPMSDKHNYTWNKSIITGAKENPYEVWMHPIRNNQYVYTEIAPFPQVILDSLTVGGKWSNKTIFSIGWGAFKGKSVSHYTVNKQQSRKYGNIYLQDCWLINAISIHSKLGKNYLNFFFHPKYGFTEMHYSFYNGTKISFVLEKSTW